VRKALTSETNFKFNNTLRTYYATLEDLLAHRTGIPKNNYVRLASDYDLHTFASKMRYLPNVGGFRDSFFYNNLMYGMAVYATEDLAGGIPWKTQVKK
jgi:CubicO group peptidase (beta-lactamase class C family)